jgi:hypothetical protein
VEFLVGRRNDAETQLREHLSDEHILELTYHVMAYNLHAVCKALRVEYDDVDARIREVPEDGGTADWAGKAWTRE